MQNWGSCTRGQPLPPSISQDQPSTGGLRTQELLETPQALHGTPLSTNAGHAFPF